MLRDLPAVLRDAPTSSVRIRYQRALLHEDVNAFSSSCSLEHFAYIVFRSHRSTHASCACIARFSLVGTAIVATAILAPSASMLPGPSWSQMRSFSASPRLTGGVSTHEAIDSALA